MKLSTRITVSKEELNKFLEETTKEVKFANPNNDLTYYIAQEMVYNGAIVIDEDFTKELARVIDVELEYHFDEADKEACEQFKSLVMSAIDKQIKSSITECLGSLIY